MKMKLFTCQLEDGPAAGETHQSVGREAPGVFLWRSPDGEPECYQLVDEGDGFALTFSHLGAGYASHLVNAGLADELVEAPAGPPTPNRVIALIGGPANGRFVNLGSEGAADAPGLIEIETSAVRVHRYQREVGADWRAGKFGQEMPYRCVGRVPGAGRRGDCVRPRVGCRVAGVLRRLRLPGGRPRETDRRCSPCDCGSTPRCSIRRAAHSRCLTMPGSTSPRGPSPRR